MKTEKVFGVIIFVGIIFRFMHWPFAGPLLALGIGSLSILYLVGSLLIFADGNFKRQNIALTIISGFFLMNACNGILFKLMFWPFSGPLLMLAVMTLPVLLIIAVALKLTTTKIDLATYYNNMISRLSVIAFVAIALLATPSVTLVKIIHSDDPERVRLQTQSMMNPENEAFQIEFDEYVKSKHSRQDNHTDETK